jgi:hypothetical protein
MKASAHGDVIIAMRDRPGTDSATELLMRLDHDHRYATLGQPDRGSDPSNAATGYHHWFG